MKVNPDSSIQRRSKHFRRKYQVHKNHRYLRACEKSKFSQKPGPAQLLSYKNNKNDWIQVQDYDTFSKSDGYLRPTRETIDRNSVEMKLKYNRDKIHDFWEANNMHDIPADMKNQRGTIVEWFPERGYGFIEKMAKLTATDNLYFHQNDIFDEELPKNPHTKVIIGSSVTYDTWSFKNPCHDNNQAINIRFSRS